MSCEILTTISPGSRPCLLLEKPYKVIEIFISEFIGYLFYRLVCQYKFYLSAPHSKKSDIAHYRCSGFNLEKTQKMIFRQ